MVHEVAGDDCRNAEEEERREHAAVRRELSRDDIAERRNDQNAEEEDEPAERLASLLPDQVLRDKLHRAAIITHRCGQRQIVVDRADKDVAKPDPQ